MTRWVHVLVKVRVLSIVVMFLLSALLAFFAKDARPQFDIEGLLPLLEDVGRDYKAMETLFGRDDRHAYVIVQNPREFEARGFARLAALTDRMSELKSVGQSESATHIDLVVKEDDRLTTTTLSTAPSSLQSALLLELNDEPHRRAYFSEDKKSALVMLTMQSEHPDAVLREAMLEEVETFLAKEGPRFGFTYRLAGYPLHRAMLTREIVQDMKATTPLLALAFLFVLLVILRKPTFVLLTILGVTLSVVWTAGLSQLLHLPLNILVQSVLVVVVVVATSDCIHFMSYFADAERDPETRTWRTLEELTAPCFYTSLTTAVGFLGLRLSSMPSVRDFGAQVALGVLSAFIITLFCILPLLSFSKANSPLSASGALDHALEKLRHLSQKHARVIVVFSILFTLVGGLSAFFIESDSGFLADLRDDHPIHETNRILEKQFRGLISIDVLVNTGDYPSDTQLAHLAHFTEALRQERAIHSVASPSDLLARFDQKLSAEAKLSRSTVLTSAMLFVPEVLTPFYHEDAKVLRVRATLKNGNSKEALETFASVRSLMKAHFPKARTQLTGQGFLSQWVNAKLVEQFATGFWVALGLVLVLMALFLRGVKWAVYSLVPNVLPLSMIVFIMVVFGVDLRMGSALALTVVFGLVVDDTIHFVVAYQKNRSLRKTYRSAGKGIFYTSLVLLVSFGTLLTSNFQINVLLGFMIAAAAVLALVSDLLVLPAMLSLLEERADTHEP